MSHGQGQISYLFIELAILAYLLAFCYEHWRLRILLSQRFWRPAFILAGVWLVLDTFAVHSRLWSFPPEGSLPLRIFGLPAEEIVLFFLHTLVCYLLVEVYLEAPNE